MDSARFRVYSSLRGIKMAREEITWEIEQIRYAKVSGDLANVILSVNYKLIAWYDMIVPDEENNLDENGMIIDPTKTKTIENGVTVHGAINLDPPNEDTSFIPLESLPKEMVAQWVKDKLGVDVVNALESQVIQKRSNLIDDNITSGRPTHWGPVE